MAEEELLPLAEKVELGDITRHLRAAARAWRASGASPKTFRDYAVERGFNWYTARTQWYRSRERPD